MLAVFLLLLWDMIWNDKPSVTFYCGFVWDGGHKTAAVGLSSGSDQVLLGQQMEDEWKRGFGGGGEVLQCYFREPMKLSRLYSVSYCCWSHSSPRPSSTDFMEAFPEVDGD